MLLTLVNGLIGAICGMSFRVHVLVPLIVFAFVEVAFVNHTGIWSSAFWLALMLIAAIEIGYLAGSATVVLCPSSSRRKTPCGSTGTESYRLNN